MPSDSAEDHNGDLPYISEFRVRRVDGILEATRAGDLSKYQLTHGCQRVIRAATEGELQMLAMTERVKADLVKAAERAAGIAEAPRGRGQ